MCHFGPKFSLNANRSNQQIAMVTCYFLMTFFFNCKSPMPVLKDSIVEDTALTVREIEASDAVTLIEASSLTWGESNMLLITAKYLLGYPACCGTRQIG